MNEVQQEQIRLAQAESSQRQHYDTMLFQEKSTNIYEEEMFSLIAILGLKLQKDGNQWCYLYGDNLQEGIAGFGDTVYLAMTGFYNNFRGEKP